MCSGRVAVKCLLKDHKGRTFLLPPHFLSGNPSVGHSHPREEMQFRESLTKAEQDFLGPRGICRKKGMISTQAPESVCTGDARQPPPGQPRGEASRHLANHTPTTHGAALQASPAAGPPGPLGPQVTLDSHHSWRVFISPPGNHRGCLHWRSFFLILVRRDPSFPSMSGLFAVRVTEGLFSSFMCARF